jgi:Calx-beta domain/Beta-propeller repeat
VRIVAGVLLIVVACVVADTVAIAAPVGGGLPMSFEPNLGQADSDVKFLARGRGYGLFLTPTESVLVLAPASAARDRRAGAAVADPVVVRMRLVGGDPAATLTGVEPRAGGHHYFVGDTGRWQRAVPAFARVRYSDVYPGISLVFYGTGRELEYDFVVAPGADPSAVALAFEGVENLRVDAGGDLVLATRGGELRLHRPVVYQDADGERRRVEAGYVLDGDRVRFRVAAWDVSRPLVIDPVLGYSTFLGGSSTDQGLGIAVDTAGNAYVTGSTISSNFPVSAVPLQPTRRGVTDAFVTKLSPTGALVYSTFLGGSGDDSGNAIAVDPATGNAYVAGTTNSTNFPVVGPFQATLRGGNDAFVAKLDPAGNALVYSTYLGSNVDDFGNGIAIDTTGNAYVTGETAAANFPNNAAVTCLNAKSSGSDAFVVQVDPGGATVGYCRFIGGTGIDTGQAIAADPDTGTVWVVGTTTSTNLPVVSAAQTTLGGRTDGFVGRLNGGGALVYLTYLGGSDDDAALAVAVDSAFNAYVTGVTGSVNFPISALPLQPLLIGGDDAFVSKLNPAGTVLTYSTYLGGTGDDAGNGIAVHPTDSTVFVAGATASLDFPVLTPLQPALGGGTDAFVTRLNAAGSGLVSATYLGGAGNDAALAITVDADGVAYVTGSTGSSTFPTSSPIQAFGGLLDAFVAQITDAGVIQFSASSFQVSETGGTATITVRRTGDTSTAATVQFATSNGTATTGSDYTATSGTLTFLTGQSSQTFTVTIAADAICDGDETVNLTLTNPGGGNVLGTRSTAVLTILDPAACVSFGAAAFQVTENRGPAVVTVVRSGPATGTVTVQLSTANGTATAPGDYTATSRTLTFTPGVRSLSVSIPIVNDTLIEGSETLTLSLTNVQGPAVLGAQRTTVTLTINDDDQGGEIQFSAAAYSVSEGAASATITIVRTGGTAGPVTVDFATGGGTATAGTDYTATTTTVTFPAGITTRTVTVPITADLLDEVNETVTLTLSNPSPFPNIATKLGARSTAVLTIVDNDVLADLQFSQAVYTVNEGVASATVTVTRTGGLTSAVSVNFATSNGPAPTGATAGSDYTATTVAPLAFAPNQTSRTVTIPLGPNDGTAEGSEFVTLTLTNPLPAGVARLGARPTALLKIVDDEAVVQFASATYSVVEGGTATITVERSGTAGIVVVPFATSNGSALAGTDYATRTGSLTFAAGVKTLSFTVPTIANAVEQSSRQVNLSLGPLVTGTAGALLGPQDNAVLTISDNDEGGVIQFSAATYTVSEATALATITITRTGGTAGPVTVDFSTDDGVGTATAGADYTSTLGPVPVTFAPGVTSRTVTIPIANDTLDEPNETVRLLLSGPAGGATLGALSVAFLTIVDNDVAGSMQFSQSLYTVSETATSALITVTRSGGAASAATIGFATSNGPGGSGAVAGTHYTATSTTVTFNAGVMTQTVSIPLPGDDATGEGDRFVTLTLSGPGGGGTVGARSTATLRITDTDLSVAFSAATYTVKETTAVATITLELTGVNATPVTVNWSTSNGTATAGSDYGTSGSLVPPSGVVTFPAGGTPGVVRTRTFTIPILRQVAVEGTETVDLTLTGAVGATVVTGPGRDVATLFITE